MKGRAVSFFPLLFVFLSISVSVVAQPKWTFDIFGKEEKPKEEAPTPHIIGSGPKLVQTTLQMKPSQNTSGFIDSDEMPSGPSIPIVPTQHASPILMPVKNVSKKDNSGFLDSE
jgi:hypothetical protein